MRRDKQKVNLNINAPSSLKTEKFTRQSSPAKTGAMLMWLERKPLYMDPKADVPRVSRNTASGLLQPTKVTRARQMAGT